MDAITIIDRLAQILDSIQNNTHDKSFEMIQSLFVDMLKTAYAQVRGGVRPSVMRGLLQLEIEIGGEDGDYNCFDRHQMVDLFVKSGACDLLPPQSVDGFKLYRVVDLSNLKQWFDDCDCTDRPPNTRELGFVLAWLRLFAEAMGIHAPDQTCPSIVGYASDTAPDTETDSPVKDKPYLESVTGMTFAYVPEGVFAMGDSFDDGVADEKPVHEVNLSAFYIATTPVTQAQWMCLMPENPSAFVGDDHPVEQVTLADALTFLERLNQKVPHGFRFDLPSEAQWEFAARSGGKAQRYAGGEDPKNVAWFEDNSPGHTAPVGSLAANDLGIYDMSGNVWEWCRDLYLTEAYRRHDKRDPVCLRGGTDRVIRGGSWHLDAWSARCARRFRFDPELFGPALGFRVVMLIEG